MAKHSFYRIINIIILPLSAFIAIQVVMSLLAALANPALLLVEFVLICVPIYAFTTNYFYNKSIKKGEQCKASLKDWIKVNAIVSIIFSVFMILACMVMLVALNNPKMMQDIHNQLATAAPAQITVAELTRLLKVYCYIFLPFSILLLVHIIITFRLISRYKHMFGPSANDPQ